MIQPKIYKDEISKIPKLYNIGGMGKIVTFKETDDQRFLIELKGIIRFEILKKLNQIKISRIPNKL